MSMKCHHYRAMWAGIPPGVLQMNLDRLRSKWSHVRRYDFRCVRLRMRATFAFGGQEITRGIFSWFERVSFHGGNTTCDFAENKTRRANTDTRLGHSVFFNEDIHQQIALIELGGIVDPKDFLGYMKMAPDGAATDNIQELKGITSRQPIDRKDGPADGRISKLLVYGLTKCLMRKLKFGG